MWQDLVVGAAVLASAAWLTWAAVLPPRWKRRIIGRAAAAGGCGGCHGCTPGPPRAPTA